MPCQHPGDGSTQSLPCIVSLTMALPRAPTASTPPLPPRAPVPIPEGQRDRGTGGHGAHSWQVLKAGEWLGVGAWEGSVPHSPPTSRGCHPWVPCGVPQRCPWCPPRCHRRVPNVPRGASPGYPHILQMPPWLPLTAPAGVPMGVPCVPWRCTPPGYTPPPEMSLHLSPVFPGGGPPPPPRIPPCPPEMSPCVPVVSPGDATPRYPHVPCRCPHHFPLRPRRCVPPRVQPPEMSLQLSPASPGDGPPHTPMCPRDVPIGAPWVPWRCHPRVHPPKMSLQLSPADATLRYPHILEMPPWLPLTDPAAVSMGVPRVP